jgi:hypothetical protein
MPKLSIPDKKMLELIKILKDRGDIRFRQEFCDVIDIPKQNIRQVKTGAQHFTALHIMRACKEYNINGNWMFGLSDQLSRVSSEVKQIKARKALKRV